MLEHACYLCYHASPSPPLTVLVGRRRSDERAPRDWTVARSRAAFRQHTPRRLQIQTSSVVSVGFSAVLADNGRFECVFVLVRDNIERYASICYLYLVKETHQAHFEPLKERSSPWFPLPCPPKAGLAS